MASDIEAVSVVFDSAGDASDDVVLLEYNRVDTVSRQLIRCCKSGRACADDDASGPLTVSFLVIEAHISRL